MSALKSWKIRNTVLILMITSGLALASLATLMDYHVHQKLIIQSIDDRLYAAAVFAEQMLPPDFHDQITDRNSLSQKEFDQLVERNNRLCEKLGLKYLWSLMLIDGQPVFTTSTSADKKLSSGNYARFFEKHSNPEFYTEAFQTMEPQYQINHDKWGSIRVALVPYIDSHGRKYLFGSSMEHSVVKTFVSSFWQYTLLVMCVLFIPAISFMIYLSRRLSTPISLLADTVKTISSGDYTQPIKVSGSHEINVISKQMESMRTSILAYVKRLNNSISAVRSFEQIVNSSPIIVYRLRFEPETWPVEFISENINLLGYSAESLMQGEVSWNDINVPDDIPAVEEKVKTFLAAGQDVYRIESRLVTSDGEPRFMECWNRFIRNKEGDITHIHGLITDITELEEIRQKEAAQHAELRKTLNDLQAFESVVNASPFTAFKLNIRNGFNVEFISENIARAGYSAKEIMNGQIEFANLVPEEALIKLRQRFMEALERGEETYTSETQIQWASGEIHPYLNSYRIIKDKKGIPVYLQGLAADITEQTLTQKTLQDLYRVVIDSDVHIYRVKLDENMTSEFVSDNYADMGYAPEDILSGKVKWEDIIYPDDFEQSKKTLFEELENGSESYAIESRLVWANGEVHWYRTWNRFIKNDEGVPVAIQGIAMNITGLKNAHARDLKYQKRLKKLAQELVQAEDKERQGLAYILHDDIGQMLAGLNMKLSVLQDTSKDKKTVELHDQITELLSRIMLTTKTLTWEISPTSLYETDIAAGLDRMAADLHKFFDLDIKVETAGVRIELDRDTSALIFRMAKELLVNIAKHSGTSTANIGISQYNDKVHMVVYDSGSGFDQENISNGSGYGLFSIREHLEHINGSMHIESIPGKGTKILMIIPMDISALN